MQVRRKALKPAYRLRISVWTDRYVVSLIADIDPRRMRMNYLWARVLRLQSLRPFLPFFAVSP